MSAKEWALAPVSETVQELAPVQVQVQASAQAQASAQGLASETVPEMAQALGLVSVQASESEPVQELA